MTTFEVGKKYKFMSGGSPIRECVWLGPYYAILQENSTSSPVIIDIKKFSNLYSEYKEPVREVRYYNVYKKKLDGPLNPVIISITHYSSINNANSCMSSNKERTGILQVTLEDGVVTGVHLLGNDAS